MGTNLAATWILKYSIDKKRPYGKTDGHALPSGHTSFAFQGASFLQRRYGLKYGIPAYVIASFTGFSRIKAKRHDTWDVIAGAVVGIGSTYIFTSPYQNEHFEFSFNSANDSYSLGMIYKF